jgi:hypothetical protein
LLRFGEPRKRLIGLSRIFTSTAFPEQIHPGGILTKILAFLLDLHLLISQISFVGRKKVELDAIFAFGLEHSVLACSARSVCVFPAWGLQARSDLAIINACTPTCLQRASALHKLLAGCCSWGMTHDQLASARSTYIQKDARRARLV